ncbi:MAG: hypothetical protein H6845_02320 [Alphaproteobacteria bacterium]|nr:MAG: hypothetical protein H6845_02320 [Alphaproteobacteria bacterium]
MTQILLTTDFFNMYIGYEILLCGVIFCLIKSNCIAWKLYFKVQMLASCIIFLGCCFFYMSNGNLLLTCSTKSYVPYVMLIGFLMKAAIFPLGLWIKIYRTIDDDIVFWVAGLITKIAVYSIIRLLPCLYGVHILQTIVSVSALAGAILAYQSYDDKEILSFHIISQVSLIICIAIFEFKINQFYYLTLIYLMHHIWTKSSLFLLYKMKKSLLCKYAIFSLVGVPITPGFISKMLTLFYMIKYNDVFSSIVLLCTSVLTTCSMEKFMNKVGIEEYDSNKLRVSLVSLLFCYTFITILGYRLLHVQ